MEDNSFGDLGQDPSFGSDVDRTNDRRASDRYRSVCRIARVTRRDDSGLWRVRNISDDGLMLSADVAVNVGETLDIALSETVRVTGRVVWADRGRCGVAFDAKIDVAATLRALAAEQRSENYRALRLPVAAEAILMLGTQSLPIDLIDISPQGAGYLCNARLDPASELDLVLPGAELRRRAIVRWTSGNRGGLWFTQPLDRTDLESIARFGSTPERQPDGALAGRIRSRGFVNAAFSAWTDLRGGIAATRSSLSGRSIRRRGDG